MTISSPSVPLQAQKTYAVTVDSHSVHAHAHSHSVYAIPASTACTEMAINPACFYTYAQPSFIIGGAFAKASFVLASQTAADWVVGVAGSDWASSTAFTLRVEEMTLAP